MKQDWEQSGLSGWYNRQLEFAPQEIKDYLAALDLKPEDTLVDFGCGNGELLRHAAPLVAYAAGVDVSPEQAALARKAVEGLPNAEIIQGRFLDCRLPERAFTKGSARKSLHHLTDEEKPLFFSRIGANFASGALFQVEDAVFNFPKAELDAHWLQVTREAERFYGPKWAALEKVFENTLRHEHVTDYDTWAAALAAGGFRIFKREQKTCFYAVLLARKQ